MSKPRNTRGFPISEKLNFYTDKTDSCWNWTGSNHKGYGKLRLNGKGHYAHRLSYELNFGPIPQGLWVLHRCDNPACINPDHLFLGTPLDNALDRKAKGRNNSESRSGDKHFLKLRPDLIVRGEQQGNSKLKDSEIREIRAKHAAGIPKRALASEYKIARSGISAIVRKTSWKHIED